MSVFDGLPGAFTGALGDTVTIYPNGAGTGTEIKAIYRAGSRPDDLYDSGAVVTETHISGASTDLAGMLDGDRVDAGGIQYEACAPMPDGRGMTRINLRRP